MKTNFKSIEKMITSNGWILVRISGSHHQYKKAGVPGVVTIPNHARGVSIGVIKSIERITGLTLR